jgi:hypothetical protein
MPKPIRVKGRKLISPSPKRIASFVIGKKYEGPTVLSENKIGSIEIVAKKKINLDQVKIYG